MAHYAFLNGNNIVTEVIAGVSETKLIKNEDTEYWYGKFRNQVCKRTSYNDNIRKNYAGISYIYDEARNAFISPKPFESWILNKDSCLWESPIPYPRDGGMCYWDENIRGWVSVD